MRQQINKRGKTMRRISILAVLACAAAILAVHPAAASEADAIIGVWWTGERDARVEIYKINNTYAGKLIWFKNPVYPEDDEQGMAGKKKIDRKNPDESLRNRRLMGLVMVHSFKYDKKNKWKSGRIYDPKKGKTYKCKMELDGDVLTVRGYVGFSMFGRTTEWTRYKDDEPTESTE